MSKKKNRKVCSKCQIERDLSRDFYQSNSTKNTDGKVNICKPCIFKDLNITEDTDLLDDVYLKRMQDVLLELNLPYSHRVWLSTIKTAKRKSNGNFGSYLRQLHLNRKNVNWTDSEFPGEIEEDEDADIQELGISKEEIEKKHDIELDTQNEKDVLRLLGYDPFEYESPKDRQNLFNKLVDYLDESTLEDGFKLSSVIEIVRTHNQIDKINAAITKNMSDMKNFAKNAGSITSLINAKDKMLKSTLDIAKENGISVKHATNKSKGAGTLSGILKQLDEYDIHEAEVNLFDVKTSHGIRQIADISNKSIYNQLMFDENDMTEMIRDQRQLIEEYSKKAEKFEEENRLLKVELAKLKKEMTQ